MSERQTFSLDDNTVAHALREQKLGKPAHLQRGPSVSILAFDDSVKITGRAALEALRAAIDAALVPEEA